MRELLAALEDVDSATLGMLQRAVNLSRGQIDQALKLLELDGAVGRTGSRYYRTPRPWQPDEERIARVSATRRLELQQMRDYVTYAGCRMEYLTRLLDDPAAEPCGRCANDTGRGMPREVNPEVVRAAVNFLRRSLRRIEPRLRWVESGPSAGAVPNPNEVGMALCLYGDAGWGRDVERGRVVDKRFSDALVVAAVRAIRDQWRPEPAPEWVTSVPARGSGRVGEFAAAVAAQLGLPYVESLTTDETGEAQPQHAMQNSVLQLANARKKLGVTGAAVLPGPVLLIDDIVDSRWTLTVAGALLREDGSGPVLPFALAVGGSDG
jgi:ATP-dependent DNA helicase RecQ